MEEDHEICRVCRLEGSDDNPLFHPCLCRGSIRFVHQECLVEWLSRSGRQHCEFCNYKYTFKPIYSPDMPKNLLFQDILKSVFGNVWTGIKHWLYFSVVFTTWLVIVPFTVSRFHNCVFAGSILTIPLVSNFQFSKKEFLSEVLFGHVIIGHTFIALLTFLYFKNWLVNGGLPAWLIQGPPNLLQNVDAENENLTDSENEDFENHLVQNNDPDNNANANPNDEHILQDQFFLDDLDWDLVAVYGERALGQDGMLIFIKHVLWIVALNLFFILVFVFLPYRMGHFFLLTSNLNFAKTTTIESCLTIFCGYILIASGFLISHFILQIMRFKWPGWICGICYIGIKVGILILLEAVLLPLLCGIWLDVCTLKAVNSTSEFRHEEYSKTPSVFLFLRWLIGIIFMFYLILCLKFVKEVMRPEVLRFVRYWDEPNFNPIYDMVHYSCFFLLRRFVLLVVGFGFAVVAFTWMPAQLLFFFFPNILPFGPSSDSPDPIKDFSFQLLLFQFIIPGMLDHILFKNSFQAIVRWWVYIFGSLVGLQSYLIGGQMYLNFLPNHQRNFEQPAAKPSFFHFRILILLLMVVLTLSVVVAMMFTAPLVVGRFIVKYTIESAISPQYRMYDVHAFIIGLQIIWVCVRMFGVLHVLLPQGWTSIKKKLKEFLLFSLKFSVLVIFAVGIIPTLLGLLFDRVVLVPLKVFSYQSPITMVWLDWIYGFFILKFSLMMVFLIPGLPIRNQIFRIYQIGLHNLPLFDFIRVIVMPVIYGLLVCLCAPYTITKIFLLIVDLEPKIANLFNLYNHLCFVSSVGFVAFCWYQLKRINLLYDHIRNERYMIGKRLEDYEPLKKS